jgi:hypothetical protein
VALKDHLPSHSSYSRSSSRFLLRQSCSLPLLRAPVQLLHPLASRPPVYSSGMRHCFSADGEVRGGGVERGASDMFSTLSHAFHIPLTTKMSSASLLPEAGLQTASTMRLLCFDVLDRLVSTDFPASRSCPTLSVARFGARVASIGY